MRILFLGTADNLFLLNLAKNLREKYNNNIIIDIISREPDRAVNYSGYYDNVWIYKRNNVIFNIPKVRYFYNLIFLKSFVKNKLRNKEYNICHIQYLHTKYRIFYDIINRKCQKIIVSFWGNDFYNTNKFEKKLNKKYVNGADLITFSNPKMKNDFIKTFGDKPNIKIIGGSTGIIDVIKKNKLSKIEAKKYFDINKDTVTITCGYTPKPEQQHIEILASLYKVKDKLPANYILLLPMTYKGYEENISDVEAFCIKYNFNYMIFKEFMDDNTMAKLRQASDIMIMVAKADQLSLSMMEYLYTENIVITGSWLPYDMLDEIGIKRIKVNNVKDIGKILIDAYSKKEKMQINLKMNKVKLIKYFSEKNQKDDWSNIYHELVRSNSK